MLAEHGLSLLDERIVHGPFPEAAILYFAWANREPGAMRVFIPLA